MESDKEKRRNVVCATTADASQVMIVLSSNRRYTYTYTHVLKGVDMKMFYFGGQTSAVYVYHRNAPSLSVSLSSVFLSISFFIPLCVHRGVTNWWFSGLKEAQMEKQMERVIGRVYAFYLRFLPPFFSSPSFSHCPLFPPPLSLL